MESPNKSSLSELQVAAEQGDAHAQFLLGTRYRKGEGVEKDEAAAFRWVKAAAEQGDADAQNDFGTMYRNGFGVTNDDAEATRWYRLAAEQGRPVALFNLGKSLLDGVGVVEDPAAAFQCFSEAAKHGYTDAISQLGTLYRLGRGTEKNLVAASTFHVIAALEGDIPSMGHLATYYGELEKIALTGDQAASLNLAKMYDRGLGVEQSRTTTLAWLAWAAKDCAPDQDPECGAEVREMRALYLMVLDRAAKANVKTEYQALRHRAGLIGTQKRKGRKAAKWRQTGETERKT